jgi:hypothetical protein
LSKVLVTLVPRELVTVTSTVPIVPAGETAMIEVSLCTVNDPADVEPKATAVAPMNPLPVILTLIPPEISPAAGEIEVTTGIF